MTKKELIEKLQPFKDDTICMLNKDGDFYEIDDINPGNYVDYSKEGYPLLDVIVFD